MAQKGGPERAQIGPKMAQNGPKSGFWRRRLLSNVFFGHEIAFWGWTASGKGGGGGRFETPPEYSSIDFPESVKSGKSRISGPPDPPYKSAKHLRKQVL